MTRRAIVSLCLLLLLAPVSAHAARASGGARSDRSVGPEVGFSSDPDQLVLGGHLCFSDVAPQLDFVPGIDVGVGDDVTVVALNGDFHFRFRLSGSQWQPYVGAGASFYSVSGNGPFDGNDTIGGGNLLVGADVPTRGGSRFYAEMRLALGDGPSFRLIGGWNFPMR